MGKADEGDTSASVGPAPNPAASLVTMDTGDFGGVPGRMLMVEVERTERISVLSLTYKEKVSSVGDSMFIARGVYEVAKARGAEYYVRLRRVESDEGTVLVMGFTNNREADIRDEFGEEFSVVDQNGRRRRLSSVATYDVIWGGRNRQLQGQK